MKKALRLLGILFVVGCTWGVADPLPSPYQGGPCKYPRFEAKTAEPGLTFGAVPDLPLPKTVLYSVTPDELLADGEVWTQKGVQAFFITGVCPEWSSDVWSADGEPWTIGASDKSFQKVKQANELCRRLGAETFLTMAFSHTFDWFDDLAWQKIENNFRQFALFARESGCTGVAIDIEYVWQQYHFVWEGYSYDGYSREQLVEKIRARATQMARAVYDEFPDAPLLTFPESAFNLGSWIHAAWIEEAARRNAPGGIHLCTEYTYRRPNFRFMLGHAWMNNETLHRMLSDSAWAYWQKKCSIAEGLWPFGEDPEDYHGVPPTPDEFRQAFAASLMVGSRYNWIYSHDARPAMLGRDAAKYADVKMDEYMRVLAQREVVTDSRYVQAARDLRALKLRDYSGELGLVPVPTFAGPREELEIGLMPAKLYTSSPVSVLGPQLWDIGYRTFQGKSVDYAKELNTQTNWMLIGPFDNKDNQGFDTPYPPEQGADLQANYDGVGGKVSWSSYKPGTGQSFVHLAKVFTPSDNVCAYALCYAVTDKPQDVQVRLGANDIWKLWIGGKPVAQNAQDGRIVLDRDIVPVTLPAGTTPILLKVCNNLKDWGFIFRITGPDGKPVPGLRLQPQPQ